MNVSGGEGPEETHDVAGDSTTVRLPAVDAATQASGVAPEPLVEPSHTLSAADQATVEALLPGTALLVVSRGPNVGARFLLDAAEVSSGRHPESDIFLDDVTVSRRHVVFEATDRGYRVRDVGSLNGTYVNRELVDEADLATGDEVQIGKFRLAYYAPVERPTA